MIEKTRHDEMRDECNRFHKAHPRVWSLFIRFTNERIARSFKHYSVNAVFERIRWETDQADVKGRSSFKINNNHRPFYARRFMKMFPQYEGFFRTRVQTSKGGRATNLPPLSPRDFD